MDRGITTARSLVETAALARIEEVEARMTKRQAADSQSPKTAARSAWALGDYHTFSTELVWEVGPVLVEACGISAGQRVLDVATGTGNVAIRAAATGAQVVASDLTPEHFPAGRREALAQGVELDWVEADAEALPFEDAEFDVVTSSFGVMFAPDHERAADELLRVCRPGGVIGLASFTPEGLGGEFFALFGKYAPPPPAGALPPVLWGSEEHVRTLLGSRVASLQMTRREYVEQASSPADYCEFFRTHFGPLIALRARLDDRVADFDEEFLEFATRANRDTSGRRAEYPYEYLLVVARTPHT